MDQELAAAGSAELLGGRLHIPSTSIDPKFDQDALAAITDGCSAIKTAVTEGDLVALLRLALTIMEAWCEEFDVSDVLVGLYDMYAPSICSNI